VRVVESVFGILHSSECTMRSHLLECGRGKVISSLISRRFSPRRVYSNSSYPKRKGKDKKLLEDEDDTLSRRIRKSGA